MPDGLSNFADLLDFFLNLLELVALIISISTLFFLIRNQIEYSKALKEILAPCGMGATARVKAFFICRKSPNQKRALIEFCILQTKGNSVIASEWRTILNEFKAFYGKASENLIIDVPNCMALAGEEFSEACDRYFKFFSKDEVKDSFGIKEDIVGWVLKVRIREAYAMPSVLLTGLLAQYEENWADFIQTYVSTAYMTESETDDARCVLTNELYLTFAWLLWGPSYELNFQKNWGGLCQLSFGDESNSLPAIIVPEKRKELAELFKTSNGDRYGELLNVVLSVYENKAYYKECREDVSPDEQYFYEKIEDGDFSFALQLDEYVPFHNYKEQKYYCTAYVWLLFELEDEDSYYFRPETSLAFFEHANLTDMGTYKFLTETLIDKSIKHFEKVLKDHPKRKYRFLCAMNGDIEEKCKARYKERMSESDELAGEFKNRIIMEPKRKPAEAFMAYDDFFDPSLPEQYEEVDLKDKKSINLLGQFYTDIYIDCFPDRDERESFDNLLKYLEETKRHTDYKYHILLMKNAVGEVIGGAIFDYFKKPNVGGIEFIAIKRNLQSAGLGSRLYHRVVSMFEEDARANHQKEIGHIFCEIEDPTRNNPEQKEKIYLEFWTKQKYKRIDFSYIQPALSENQAEVDDLWLIVNSKEGDPSEIDAKVVEDFIFNYVKYAMSISDPAKHPSFQKMKKELKEKGKLRLSDIKAARRATKTQGGKK